MKFINPYTPGAGFMPAYMAGREKLLDDAEKYLDAIVKWLSAAIGDIFRTSWCW